MINFKYIELTNYGPYDFLRYEFTTGQHLILGMNGSGKSTIPEALLWTLFKVSPKGTNPSKNGKGKCSVEIGLESGGVEYKIIRYHGHKKYKTSVRLYIINEEEENISSRLPSNTDKSILKLIGASYELFSSSLIVMQGLPTNFSTMTPTVRKSILENILGFSVWDTYKSLFGEETTKLRAEHSGVEANKTKYREKMIGTNSQVETMAGLKETKKKDIEKQVKELQKIVKMTDQDIQKVLKQKNKKFGERTTTEVVSELMTLRSSLSLMSSRKMELDCILRDKICPTCKQDYPETMMSSAQKEVDRLINKLNSLGEITTKLQVDQEQLQGFDQKISQLQQGKMGTENQILGTQRQLQSNDPTSQIKELEELLAKLSEKVNIINESIQTLTSEMEYTNYIEKLLVPSSDFRTNILEKYLIFLNQSIENFCPLLLPNLKITLCVDSRRNGIDLKTVWADKRKATYKSLSGGEKRRLDVILLLSIQQFLFEHSGVSSNVVFFDEVFEAIDKEGLAAIVNTLHYSFSDDICSYVISHDDNLKSYFESVLQVTKIEGCGELNVQ